MKLPDSPILEKVNQWLAYAEARRAVEIADGLRKAVRCSLHAEGLDAHEDSEE